MTLGELWDELTMTDTAPEAGTVDKARVAGSRYVLTEHRRYELDRMIEQAQTDAKHEGLPVLGRASHREKIIAAVERIVNEALRDEHIQLRAIIDSAAASYMDGVITMSFDHAKYEALRRIIDSDV